MNITDGALWEALKEQWDRSSEYVIHGGKMYRVVTPNGMEKPIFIIQDASDFYGETSTGMLRSEKRDTTVDKSQIKPLERNKRSKPGVTSNPGLTDVEV